MVNTIDSLKASNGGLARATTELVGRLRANVVVVRDGRRGSGSGVIWREDGLIVTNYHVTPGQRAQVTLIDGRELDATVSRSDPKHDLAVLQVNASRLPAALIGDSDRLRIGELVFAVGNPLGLPGAVTVGIVSATPANGGEGSGMVRADVSLAPGNSGGLLATADGKVVGVNSMVRAPGLALAVPSNRVTELLARPMGEPARLGVTLLLRPLPAAWVTEATGDTGFLVTSVEAGGPADVAGLGIGDVIIGTKGDALAPPETLTRALASLSPGDGIDLLILRAGQARGVRVLADRALAEAA